jgi:hypothetical protein
MPIVFDRGIAEQIIMQYYKQQKRQYIHDSGLLEHITLSFHGMNIIYAHNTVIFSWWKLLYILHICHRWTISSTLEDELDRTTTSLSVWWYA